MSKVLKCQIIKRKSHALCSIISLIFESIRANTLVCIGCGHKNIPLCPLVAGVCSTRSLDILMLMMAVICVKLVVVATLVAVVWPVTLRGWVVVVVGLAR